MSDDNPGVSGRKVPSAATDDGRRQADRRQSQQPFDGPDRRKADRRSGTDRRTTPRVDGAENADD